MNLKQIGSLFALGIVFLIIVPSISLAGQSNLQFDTVKYNYKSLFSQEHPLETVNVLDSILALNSLTEEITIQALYHKGMLLFNNYKNEDAIKCFEQIFSTSTTIKYSKGELLFHIGLCYENLFNNDKAEKYFVKSLEYTSPDQKELLAKLTNSLGRIYYNMGIYEKANINYIESHNLSSEIKDSISIIRALSNLGILNDIWENYNKAIDIYLEALQIAKECENEHYIAILNNNLGVSHFCLGEYHKALNYYQNALEIELKNENMIDVSGSYHNIGNIHEVMEDYNKALSFYIKALDIQDTYNDFDGMVLTLHDIGIVHGCLGDYNLAISYCKKSLAIAIAKNMKNKEMAVHESLAKLYSQQVNFDSAFHHQTKFIAIKVSLFTVEKNKEIAKQQASFKNKQDENKIAILSKEKEVAQAKTEQQRILTIGYIVIIILLVIALFIGHRLFYNKKIAHEKLKNQEKKIVEMSMKVMKQNEEFIDNLEYGRVVQKAVLTGDTIINKWFADSFYINLPQLIVSGDFYWIKNIGQKVYVIVSDCTGHGVPGGFMSMLGLAFLNEIITDEFKYYPNELLDILRDRIKDALNQTDLNASAQNGMDLACCLFNFDDMKMYFAGAHMPLWHQQINRIDRIKGDLMPIGVSVKEKPFSMQELSFKKGDRFYMFTDGMIDQFSSSGEKYSSKRLENKIHDTYEVSGEKQKEQILNSFLEWKGEMPQTDDALLLGLQV